MMNQALRLRKHADFQAVYQHSRKQFSRQMSYFFALRTHSVLSPEKDLSGPRIGLTVGKVIGKAVDRNRIKRRLRAAVSRHAGILAGHDVDVVLHPRRALLTLAWPQIEKDIVIVFSAVRRSLLNPPACQTVPRGATEQVFSGKSEAEAR